MKNLFLLLSIILSIGELKAQNSYVTITGNVTSMSGGAIISVGSNSRAVNFVVNGTGNLSNARMALVGMGVTFSASDTNRINLKQLMVNHTGYDSRINSGDVRVKGSLHSNGGKLFTDAAGSELSNNGRLLLKVYDSVGLKFPSLYFKKACNNSDSIAGNVIVERYFRPTKLPASGGVPLNRAWRTYAPGVISTKSIQRSIQQNLGDSPIGFGTYLFGSGANFDANYGVSMYRYSNGWQAVTDLLQSISIGNYSSSDNVVGNAYYLIVTGPRSAGGFSTVQTRAEATILRSSGQLYGCEIRFADGSLSGSIRPERLNSNADGFSLIGNPYWNYLSLAGISGTELTSTYYIFNPISDDFQYIAYNQSLGTSSTTGGVLSNADTYSGLPYTPSTGNAPNSRVVHGFDKIQPGHGFFVQHVAGNNNPPNLTIRPSDISTSPPLDWAGGSGSIRFYSNNADEVVNNERAPALSISLHSLNNDSYLISDAVQVGYGLKRKDNGLFTQHKVLFETEDSQKFFKGSNNLYIDREKALVIDSRSPIFSFKNDTIPLGLSNLNKSSYQLLIEPLNIGSLKEVVLLDAKKEIGEKGLSLVAKTPLDLSQEGHVFPFSKTNDQDLKRFKVLLVENFSEFKNLYLAEQQNQEIGLMAYPNPSVQMLNLYHPELAGSRIEIHDVAGRTWYQKQLDAQAIGGVEVDVRSWSPGAYLVRIEKLGKVMIGKILKSN